MNKSTTREYDNFQPMGNQREERLPVSFFFLPPRNSYRSVIRQRGMLWAPSSDGDRHSENARREKGSEQIPVMTDDLAGVSSLIGPCEMQDAANAWPNEKRPAKNGVQIGLFLLFLSDESISHYTHKESK